MEAFSAERLIRLEVDESGQRVDKYLAERIPELSRSQAQRLIREGLVTVNGQSTLPAYRVKEGECLTVRIPPKEKLALAAEELPLKVVYEDEDIVVVDKPAGMVVHPSAGHPRGTLMNALLAHIPSLANLGEDSRPGIVHRLDKETSGLMVVAKNDSAQRFLKDEFKGREVEKTYLALVEGRPSVEHAVVEAPIGRDPKNRKRMAVVRGGREARTEYRVLESYPRHSLLKVRPETGRTHQVRVHLAFIGHPVVGDRVYGRKRLTLPMTRYFLHAQKLMFRHPKDGQYVEFETALPDELQEALKRLRQETQKA